MSVTDVVYECDGCGMQGTEAQVEVHIIRDATWESGDFKPVHMIKCWGILVVGSPAWSAWRERGIHPMSSVSVTAATISLQNGAGNGIAQEG